MRARRRILREEETRKCESPTSFLRPDCKGPHSVDLPNTREVVLESAD